MNTLELLSVSGELGSYGINELEINGVGGDMLLTMDLFDEGAISGWLVLREFPTIRPRICVPAENRTVRVRC